MKDLKSYKEIFCSSELELYFMEENGSCSFVKRKYDYIYRYEEAIVATNALMPLVDYPSSDDSLTIVDRVAFLFGTSDVLKTEDIHPPKTGISVHFSGSLV